MMIRDMTNEELELWDSAVQRDAGSSMAFIRLVKLSDADAEVLTSVREILDRLGRLPERAGGGGAAP